MTLTHGSLFAGIGTFDKGFEEAGIRTSWAVEIDPLCRSVLRRHWPDLHLHDDVKTAGAHNLPPVDIISFGSPCQDLSISGKRVGFKGERSGLFYEAVRIIRELRPTFALWENVPGALSSAQGRDFGCVLDILADAGAMDICWRIMDAQWFGVPQRRRRLFVVADFGGQRTYQVLFNPSGMSGDSASSQATGQSFSSGIDVGFAGSGNGDLAGTLTACYGKGANRSADDALIVHTSLDEGFDGSEDETVRGTALMPAAFDLAQITSATNRSTVEAGQPTSTLAVGSQMGVTVPPAVGFTADITPKSGLNVSPTLLEQKEVNVAYPLTSGWGVRRLTPTECERLQGLPDLWTAQTHDGKVISDSTRYHMVGNAGAVPILAWIGQRMSDVLEEVQ